MFKHGRLLMVLLSLLLLCCVIGYWFFMDAPLEGSLHSQKEPDAMMFGVKAVQYDDKGQPLNRLQAKQANFFNQSGITTFVMPDLLVAKKAGEPWHITANKGQSLNDQTQFILEEAVRLYQKAGANNRETLIETEYLQYFPQADRAETTRAIQLTQPAGKISAEGLKAHFKENVFHLLSNVKAFYENKR